MEDKLGRCMYFDELICETYWFSRFAAMILYLQIFKIVGFSDYVSYKMLSWSLVCQKILLPEPLVIEYLLVYCLIDQQGFELCSPLPWHC